MKTYPILIALSLIFLGGCGASRMTLEEQEAVAQKTAQKLDSRKFRINVDYMMPRRGGSKSVFGSYHVTIDDTVIDSYLPYFGVAYRVPYGGIAKVLTFKDDIEEYADSGWNRGKRVIALSTDNDEDFLVYTITVYDDGSAEIQVRCRNREDISYRGSLVTDE